jgi:hypothetical protein
MTQVPLAPPPPTGGPIDGWLYLLWRRLTQAGQILWGSIDTSGSNLTDITTRNHVDLQNHNTTDYYHLTQANHTDLTDGGATTLHKHDHSLQDNLNTTNYNHLTTTEKSDLLGGTLITLDHSNASLTGERALAVSTGLSLTDTGAGAALTVNQVSFVGDSGSGGFIGAVPAPAIGDGAAARYLAADGAWRDPGTAGTIYHNNLVDLEGGIATNIFEATAFESTAFQTSGVTEYFHVLEVDYDNLQRQKTVLATAVNTQLDDTSGLIYVTASGKTISLPELTQVRIGQTWTIVQNCFGFVIIQPKPATTDAILLPENEPDIRLDDLGSTLTLKALSLSYWIVI